VSDAPTRGEFSIEQYRELLRAIRTGGYRFAFFDESPAPGDVLLRHDVDLSLRSALAMAEVEAEENVQSTWFLMTRSTFYNLDSAEGTHALARLRELGHRIGHHAVHPQLDLDERFERVVAWHNPDPSFMRLEIPGAVNVMRPPFFDSDHYRSDSNQNWRGASPREALARGDYEWLQLLIHPEIWVYPGGTMRETMEAFLEDDRAARLEQLRRDRIDLS
jgi:hypothetical protein